MPRDTINTNQARPMAATLVLGKALGAMCFIPCMSRRYAAASASHNLRSSPSRLAVSEGQSRTQCSRVRRCQKCVFPGSRNARRSAESRRDSANSTSRALDSLCQRNLDTPDVTVDGHAVGLERILCRALQHGSRAQIESRAVPWARDGRITTLESLPAIAHSRFHCSALVLRHWTSF